VAHSKSAKKRVRQNAERRLRNRSAKSAQRTAVKKFHAATEAGDANAAAEAFQGVQKRVDSNVAKGVIPKRTAARIKSQLATRLSELRQTTADAE